MSEQLEIEFTIEPFVPATPGRHVTAAIDAARESGLEVEVGPFGTRAIGAPDAVLDSADRIIRQALTHGATRVSLQIVRPGA